MYFIKNKPMRKQLSIFEPEIENMEEQATDLHDLRKLLPKGYVPIIAAKYNISKEHVYNVAAGRCKSRTEIYLELLKMAEDERQRRSEIEERLKRLRTPV